MTIRIPACILIICVAAAAAVAQTSLEGRWSSAAQSSPALLLDLKLDGAKVTGTLRQEGVLDAQQIELGTIVGKTLKFQTTRGVRQVNGTTLNYIFKWIGEQVDDSSVRFRQDGPAVLAPGTPKPNNPSPAPPPFPGSITLHRLP